MTTLSSAEELELKRRRSRRRMAQIAFGALVFKGLLYSLGLLLHPDPQALATAAATTAPVIGPIAAAEVAIVLGYVGASAFEASVRSKNGNGGGK